MDFVIGYSGNENVSSGKKKQITLRLDPDMVEFFKAGGRGYQSSFNAALRRYMEVHQRRLKST